MISLPPTRYILPNLFTISATFCGFAAIWIATQAQTGAEFYAAASLICLGVFLDGFDGRIARWVDGESKFGGQLDSLSDFLTFGVAPAMLAYSWGMRPLGVPGLIAAFVFAACAMIRLARFNVEAEEHGGASRYFTGLPSPMGGLSVAVLVGINSGLLGREHNQDGAQASLAVFVVLVGLLMVSTVPFRTFKDVRPTWRNRLVIAAILAAVVIISIRVDFMVALATGLVGYLVVNLAGGMVGAARFARVRAGRSGAVYEEEDDEDDEPTDL